MIINCGLLDSTLRENSRRDIDSFPDVPDLGSIRRARISAAIADENEGDGISSLAAASLDASDMIDNSTDTIIDIVDHCHYLTTRG